MVDHFICSHDLHQRITSLHILDKSPCSDHLPIHAVCNLDAIGTIDSCEGSESKNCSTVPAINYQWSKATDVDIDNYYRGTHMTLKSIVIPSAIYCTDVDCKHANHIRDIDTYYDNICDTLVVVSKKYIPSSTFKCSSDYIVPGFNEHLKDLHEKARQCYLQWKASGRSRSDHTHAEMRVSRLQFKYTLRHCRANETMMRADALANALKNKNSTAFWKDVQKMASSNIPLASKVGDAVGNEQITDMWHHHFSEILNSVHNTDSKSFVCDHIASVSPKSKMLIDASAIIKSLKEIKLGKSAGIDGLAAEHFVYSHSSISVHLALLFTCMLNHGHVPTAFMKTSIIPILKNRNGDSSDKNNYRPIAIVTAMSKLFELCLSKLLDTFLVTSDNQFGFKRKHATDLCIYTVKSVIKYYNYFSSPVYTCFLDASKAFDRVNHWTLFKKLLIKGVPVILVRILCIWYRCQQLCIQWGKTKSSFFTISNGVRQGGILSPKLFSVYMDDLSNMLIRSGVGCYIDNVCVNHVFYADDLCLMAPCAIALQELLNICHSYSIIVDLNFNAKKSFCFAFTPRLFKLSLPYLHINNIPISYVDSVKYLGFTFAGAHKDDNDILRQMRTLYARSNRLLRIFHGCSTKVLIELGRSYCGSFYCSYLWTQFNKSTRSKIRVAYNDLYRKILHVSRRSSASEMFVKNNIPNFESLLRKESFSFTSRLKCSSNAIISTIESCWILKYVIWKPWHIDRLFI